MEKNLDYMEAIEKLKHLVEEVRTCMLVNKGKETEARPMSTMEVDDEGGIWFFTKEDKEVSKEAAAEQKTYLYYSHPDKSIYVSVEGSPMLVKDKEKMKEIYTPLLKAWFPEGLDSPDIVLLKITPERAYYWDAHAAKLVVLYEMVKSAVTGQQSHMGEHGELNIK